jgi:hypothetical protein
MASYPALQHATGFLARILQDCNLNLGRLSWLFQVEFHPQGQMVRNQARLPSPKPALDLLIARLLPGKPLCPVQVFLEVRVSQVLLAIAISKDMCE